MNLLQLVSGQLVKMLGDEFGHGLSCVGHIDEKTVLIILT